MSDSDPGLESRLADLGRWTRAAIHMLNNSLTGILGYAKLGQEATDEAMRTRAFEQIERSGTMLRERARILLRYGRALSIDDEPPTCRAHDAVEAALQLVIITSPDAARVVRPGGEKLPPLAAHESAVAQILASLIENALDAVGGDAARVTLRAERDGSAAVLTVIDDGVGMRAEMIPRAFEPFVTIKAGDDDAIGGDGLGLSLAQRMAEAYGGRIELMSALGDGTHASLHCPLTDD